MDHLEQRIQALEQEVQLLKGQIRATLLDIHEQLLTNAYPSLRMDGDGQASSAMGRPDAHLSKTAALQDADTLNKALRPVSQPPIKQVKPAQTANTVNDFDFEAEIEASRVAVGSGKSNDSDRPFFNVTDWSVLESIAQWVTAKVEEIGPERTRAILETYAQNQYWDPQIADALMQFSAAPNTIRLSNKSASQPSAKEQEETVNRFRKAVANIGRR